MKRFRITIAVILLILIVLILVFIDYHDLSWHTNRGNYIGLLSGVLGIASLLISNVSENKRVARG